MQTSSPILRQTSLEILSTVESMPTLPDRFIKIQAILDDTDSTLHALTKIIETDHVTAATILKIANSTYYNPLGAPVSNLAYAISRLGRKETGDIALSMSLLYGFAIPAGIAMIRNFWAHAFAVAQISRFIAQQPKNIKDIDPDTLFMAALLHDIGRIIISMRVDMSYFEKDFSTLGELLVVQGETQAYGIDHAEAGAIVLKQWGLSPDICDIVASHHQQPPITKSMKICQFSDVFAAEHLNMSLNIEDVQIALKEGLLEQALKSFADTL
ncbi:MAG TPA: HDOD domain-containing protein [Mariprofundaceae bacterium]|nr:HDOD domain-containing protein [Mariprofundaceae bacterium]